MKTGRFTLAFAYLRLSNEEAQGGESSSITNQRMIVQNYCKQNNITLVREFVDDGYSGGNFNRPGFKEMLKQLEQGKADASFEDNTVVDYAASQNDKLEAQEGLYTSDPICVVCRKGDMEFVRYLDMFVSWQISSGWQAETYEKWWGTEPAELDYIW